MVFFRRRTINFYFFYTPTTLNHRTQRATPPVFKQTRLRQHTLIAMPYNALIHAAQDPNYAIMQRINRQLAVPELEEGSVEDRIRYAFHMAFWKSLKDDLMNPGASEGEPLSEEVDRLHLRLRGA
jgi:hypothetical protein